MSKGQISMSKKIPAKQLVFAVSAFIIASSLLTSNLYYFARNDAWVAVLIGFAAAMMMISIYSGLSKRYPGLSLIDITAAVFGRVLGKVVSTLYIFYFLSLAYFNLRDLGDFIKGMVLPSTPMTMIMISFILVCAMAVRKGPAALARYGFIASFIAVAAILFNALLSLNIVDPKHLQPSLELPVMNYLIGAHIVTMLPFCEIIAFMMFIPDMQRPAELGRAMRYGLCIGAFTLMIIVLRDITVLGPFITVSTMPTYSTIRLIDIGDILTRLEIVYAIILVGLLFYKVSIIYYATVNSIARLFETGSYRPFIYIFGVLIVVYAQACFPALSEHVEWNLTAAATYSSFFLLLLPLLTLIVSRIRGPVKGKLDLSRETV
jgi:spore germination protein KB